MNNNILYYTLFMSHTAQYQRRSTRRLDTILRQVSKVDIKSCLTKSYFYVIKNACTKKDLNIYFHIEFYIKSHEIIDLNKIVRGHHAKISALIYIYCQQK